MAIYLSHRALGDSIGITEGDLSNWKFSESHGSKVSSSIKSIKAPIESGVASETSATWTTERTSTDADVIRILQSHKRFNDAFSEGLRIGNCVRVDSDDYRHGCIPVFSINNRRFGDLAAYVGEGHVAQPKQKWWRRLLSQIGFGRQGVVPVSLQIFGSADNYGPWKAGKSAEMIKPDDYYPSSPDGLSSILGVEADVPVSDINAEIENDILDKSSPEFLCNRFDRLVDALFNNANRSGGTPRILSRAAQVDSHVTIWGIVYGVRDQEVDSAIRSRTILMRPIIIRSR